MNDISSCAPQNVCGALDRWRYARWLSISSIKLDAPRNWSHVSTSRVFFFSSFSLLLLLLFHGGVRLLFRADRNCVVGASSVVNKWYEINPRVSSLFSFFFSFYLVEEEEATRHFNNNRLSLWCVLHRKVYVHIEKKRRRQGYRLQSCLYSVWITGGGRLVLSVEWLGPVCGTCVFVYTTVWNTFFFSFPFDGLFHTAASGDDGRGRRNSCWISIPNSSRTAVALLRVERNP